MSSHWKDQKEKSGVFSISILVWIALKIGRRPVLFCLVPVSLFYVLFARDAVTHSKRYLTKVLPRKPKFCDVWKHFYYFSVVSIDRLYFVAGKTESLEVDVDENGALATLEEMDAGCLWMVSHLGSFDALRSVALFEKSMPLKIVMDHKHNAVIMKLIDDLNPGFAQCIIDSNQSAPALVLQLSEYLKERNMIGMMADRLMGEEMSSECEFLGSKARLPAGPWLIASALKVPVLLCFALYQGGNRYTLHIELVDTKISISRKNRSEILAEVIQAYANRIEYYVKLQPYNWFNFYEFWDEERQENIKHASASS